MIPHALSGLTFVERFYSYPLLSSTNTTARALENRPQRGIFCIQTDQQTEGRGRRGGTYFSNSNGGLWVSLVIPVSDIRHHFIYNRAISLAILITLEQCADRKQLFIKWPNDIYWGGKKICGILLENHNIFDDVLVVGFGINVNMKRDVFPAELSDIATSVTIETNRTYSLSSMLRAILRRYKVIVSSDQGKVHFAYSERLLWKGRMITINGRDGILSGVSEDGTLLLSDKGRLVPVTTGSPVVCTSTGVGNG